MQISACSGARFLSGTYGVAGLHVDQVGVPLAERPPAAVLTTEADGGVLEHERAEGQRLARRPVDRPPALHGLAPRREDSLDLGVAVEAGGYRAGRLGDRAQGLVRDPGLDRREREVGRQARPGPAEAGLHRHRVVLAAVDLAVLLLHLVAEGLGDRLDLVGRELAGHDELLGVELADRHPVADLAVHQRLGERRLVPLVVAVAAIADHVDDDVLAECLAEVERQLADEDDRLRILAVDVEDRHLDHLGDIGAVPGRPTLARRRGEADLVVDDDVDRPAGAIPVQLREVQGLGHQPLAGEGGIAVDQDRQAELAVPVLEPPLLGPDPPLDDRVDGLQVARVGGQRQVDLVLVRRDVVGREAEVILDVAVAADGLGQVLLELAEDHPVRLVQRVRQHVEPAPVRHPEHDLADPERGRPLDDRVQERDQHLAPFEREPLLADIVRGQERLEQLGRIELVDDPPFLPQVEPRPVPDRLHPLLEPVADLGVADVHVLDADLAAIRRPQARRSTHATRHTAGRSACCRTSCPGRPR